MRQRQRTAAAGVVQGGEQLVLDLLGLAALALVTALAVSGW